MNRKLGTNLILGSIFYLSSCSGGYGPADEHDINMCFSGLKYGNESDRENCEVVTKNRKAFEELALRTVRHRLKDPHSAIFEDISVYDDAVFGKVNAKNGFGAYGGMTSFSLTYEDGKMIFKM